MKLSAAMLAQLRKSHDGQDLMHMLDDACELLTAQIVLRIKARAKKYHEEMERFAVGSQERQILAALINSMNQLMVELAEAN